MDGRGCGSDYQQRPTQLSEWHCRQEEVTPMHPFRRLTESLAAAPRRRPRPVRSQPRNARDRRVALAPTAGTLTNASPARAGTASVCVFPGAGSFPVHSLFCQRDVRQALPLRHIHLRFRLLYTDPRDRPAATATATVACPAHPCPVAAAAPTITTTPHLLPKRQRERPPQAPGLSCMDPFRRLTETLARGTTRRGLVDSGIGIAAGTLLGVAAGGVAQTQRAGRAGLRSLLLVANLTEWRAPRTEGKFNRRADGIRTLHELYDDVFGTDVCTLKLTTKLAVPRRAGDDLLVSQGDILSAKLSLALLIRGLGHRNPRAPPTTPRSLAILRERSALPPPPHRVPRSRRHRPIPADPARRTHPQPHCLLLPARPHRRPLPLRCLHLHRRLR